MCVLPENEEEEEEKKWKRNIFRFLSFRFSETMLIRNSQKIILSANGNWRVERVEKPIWIMWQEHYVSERSKENEIQLNIPIFMHLTVQRLYGI